MNKLLTKKHYDTWLALLEFNINNAFAHTKEREWNVEQFRFFTAVSVMSSSKIEGETLEIDSYLKHKIQDIEYLPNLTEKPNELFEAYEFARDNKLCLVSFLEAHSISTKHLLPENQRGVVRSNNMLIMDQQTQRIQFEAASASIVKKEFEGFWLELEELLEERLNINEIFYFASLIHLIFVKIHPFNDGNGRTARLLEKWFIAQKLGEKAWYIGSEFYYYNNLKEYYNNLEKVGIFYERLDYEKALPFLLMLPKAIESNNNIAKTINHINN
jgi:Fic family protein